MLQVHPLDGPRAGSLIERRMAIERYFDAIQRGDRVELTALLTA